MFPTIETDLINPILYDEEYKWGFILKNKPLKRPTGEVLFTSCIDIHPGISSRVSLVENKNDMYLVAQLGVINIEEDEQHEINYKALVEYRERKKNQLLQTIDLDNPYYNTEWFFLLSKDFSKSFIKDLKAINIPIYPWGMPINDRLMNRTIWIANGSNYMTYKWSVSNKAFYTISNLMNYLLNFSLQKVHSAYLINRE
jgi:hypothetical protein